MPAKLFFELNEDKQKKIIAVGISEFAACGYTNSSTNRIVKSCGISKGSLFQYFSNKEELYFFILDTVTTDYIESIGKKTNSLSPELFERVIEYAALEFSWYIQNPEKARLIIGAFTKNDTGIYQKTMKRYCHKELDIFDSLLKDIDLSHFDQDKQNRMDILQWVLKGFKDNFLESVEADNNSFEQIQKEYIKRLTEYMEILKTGLLK